MAENPSDYIEMDQISKSSEMGDEKYAIMSAPRANHACYLNERHANDAGSSAQRCGLSRVTGC